MLEFAQKARGDKDEMFDTLDDLLNTLDSKRPEQPKELDGLGEDLLRSFAALQRHSGLMRIFCNSSAILVLNEFIATQPGSTNRIQLRGSLESLHLLEKRLASVASNDLGMPVQGFPFEETEDSHQGLVEILCPDCFTSIRAPVRRRGSNRCKKCSLEFEVAT